jgi:ABC-type antimicrobial peptide transport system permease subunit
MPEIAVRMSFGASSAQIFRLVAGEGMVAVAAGLILGCLAALGLNRAISNLLFGVSPTDPATYVSVTLVLGAVGFISCLIPALRASRIDAIANLRSE